MNKNYSEKDIREIMSGPIEIPCEVEGRINETCKQIIDGRGFNNMKRFGVKKIVACVAIAVALVGGTAFAYTVVTKEGHSTKRVEDYDKVAKEKKEVYIPKKLSNGYQFIDAGTQEGERGAEFTSMTVMYTEKGDIEEVRKNGGDSAIYLNVYADKNAMDDMKNSKTITKNGVDFEIAYTTNKYVPNDYQLTEEDIENQKRDDYFIAYGTENVEVHNTIEVKWEVGGYGYSLLTWNEEVSEEELIESAVKISSQYQP